MKKVTFKKDTITMAGHLYLPEDFSESKIYPAIVCSHPGGGVKEQTSGLYAQKLAEQGFVTLAFDAAYQGESGGEPRLKEDPNSRVEDIIFVVDYLQTLRFVDKEKIGALGVCAGGGYTIEAAKVDRRIKAVISVSGADFGAVVRRGWLGKSPSSMIEGLLQTVAQQRTAEANGAKVAMAPYASEKADNHEIPELNEGYEYYRTSRAMHPNSPSYMTLTSMGKLMSFDTYANIETLLKQPTLIVAGSKAGTRWISNEWHQKIQGKKKLVIIEGASHFDLYDIPQYVDAAMKEITLFAKEYIS